MVLPCGLNGSKTEFSMKSDEYQTHLIARGHSKKESGNSFIKSHFKGGCTHQNPEESQ